MHKSFFHRHSRVLNSVENLSPWIRSLPGQEVSPGIASRPYFFHFRVVLSDSGKALKRNAKREAFLVTPRDSKAVQFDFLCGWHPIGAKKSLFCGP